MLHMQRKTWLLNSTRHRVALRFKDTMEIHLQKYIWTAWLTTVIISQIYDCLQINAHCSQRNPTHKRQNNALGQRWILHFYFIQLSFLKSCFEMNSLQKQSVLRIKRASTKRLRLRVQLFGIPWIIMQSSLSEMVYLVASCYYFTFIESQQNNEHKAKRKVWPGNLSSACFYCLDHKEDQSI